MRTKFLEILISRARFSEGLKFSSPLNRRYIKVDQNVRYMQIENKTDRHKDDFGNGSGFKTVTCRWFFFKRVLGGYMTYQGGVYTLVRKCVRGWIHLKLQVFCADKNILSDT